MNPFTAVAMAGMAACAAASAGIYTVSVLDDAVRRYSTYCLGFAAGVLIAVSFLHLFPKSLDMAGDSPLFLSAGFFGLYLVDRVLEQQNHDDRRGPAGSGVVAMIGIGLHSLLDGVIFSVTFSAGVETGVLAAAGMILHEFPEGVIMFTLLRRFGLERKRALWTAFLVAGATTPAGALASYPLVRFLEPAALAPLLAVSGGALFYVGASHLLPLTMEKGERGAGLSLFAGAAAAALAVMMKHA